MEKSYRAATVILLLSFLLFLLNGCGFFSSMKKSTRKIGRSFSFQTGGLKKKVAFLAFENPVSVGSPVNEVFTGNLLESLKRQCPSIIPILPDDPDYPEEMRSLPRTASGSLDRLALARLGRLRGINAVVSARLAAVEAKSEERGILWYKDVHHLMEIAVRGEAYDTETGAKILDEGFLHSLEVGVGEDEIVGPETLKDPALFQKAFPRLALSMAESTCDALRSIPWKGYVISLSADRVTLSAGKEIGLKAGETLAVYDSTEIMEGASGERFFLPGRKVGEVKITDLSPGHAEGAVVTDQGIKVGSSVRPK